MTQRTGVFAAMMMLGLAACQPVPAQPEGNPAICGAPDLQGLVGQPRTVLDTMRFAGPIRIVEPGMMVTMDYLENRLNIWIGPDGRIARVTCG